MSATIPHHWRRIVLASNNSGKLREFAELLAPLGVELIPQAQLGVPEAAEPFVTYVENALAKARQASRLTGLPALADDSGLCVEALDGAPGVRSARYAESLGSGRSDVENNALLVRNLAGISDRRARYVAVLVLVRGESDPEPIIAQGVWQGEIVDEPRGNNGFGYDPHFYLPTLGKTASELAAVEKNRISHRSMALTRLIHALSTR
jgi:XTP/dITP diphosphohydrolase